MNPYQSQIKYLSIFENMLDVQCIVCVHMKVYVKYGLSFTQIVSFHQLQLLIIILQ